MDVIFESSDPPIKLEKRKGGVIEMTTSPQGLVYHFYPEGKIISFKRVVVNGEVIEHSHIGIIISIDKEGKPVIKSLHQVAEQCVHDVIRQCLVKE